MNDPAGRFPGVLGESSPIRPNYRPYGGDTFTPPAGRRSRAPHPRPAPVARTRGTSGQPGAEGGDGGGVDAAAAAEEAGARGEPDGDVPGGRGGRGVPPAGGRV